MTVEQIDAYHRSLGWAGIGYHYLIDLKGQIHKGRDIRRPGATAAVITPIRLE